MTLKTDEERGGEKRGSSWEGKWKEVVREGWGWRGLHLGEKGGGG